MTIFYIARFRFCSIPGVMEMQLVLVSTVACSTPSVVQSSTTLEFLPLFFLFFLDVRMNLNGMQPSSIQALIY